jgi:hypothetical protein
MLVEENLKKCAGLCGLEMIDPRLDIVEHLPRFRRLRHFSGHPVKLPGMVDRDRTLSEEQRRGRDRRELRQ